VRGQELMAAMQRQHGWITAEAHRGAAFPLLGPTPPSPAAPKSV
jgi:hypothetical protein